VTDHTYPVGARLRVIAHAGATNHQGEPFTPKLGYVHRDNPDEYLSRGAVQPGVEGTVSAIPCDDQEWPFWDGAGGGFYLELDDDPSALILARADFVERV